MSESPTNKSKLPYRIRMKAGSMIAESFFRAASFAGRLHPHSDPAHHGLTVEKNIPYREGGSADHLLDIYRPVDALGPLPVILYIHGGGFRMLSKDTHWVMALAFARRGFLVVNINYRLAPRYPYPAALEDVCAAYVWLVDNATRIGADLSRLVIAGESAGANLTAVLAIATSYRRPEPFARAVFDTGVTPIAAIPACGVFQVSDVARFRRKKNIPAWLFDRLHEVEQAYLELATSHAEGKLDLADPVVFLERGIKPDRPLPPFFTPVGTGDILLDDTRRLKKALDNLGVRCEARYYPGEVHAFHAFPLREAAKKCWRDTYAFLDEVLAQPTVQSHSTGLPTQ